MHLVPRPYLLIVFAPLAVLVVGNMLFNIWVDPLDLLRNHRLSTRTTALPALLFKLERPPASEPDIEVFLLGTSRTHEGHDMSIAPEAINLGIDGASDSMIDHLLVGLLQASTRPHVYFVDTMGGSRGKLEGNLLHYLLAGGTTKRSLRHIVKQMRERSIPDADSRSGRISPEQAKENRRENSIRLKVMRKGLAVGPHTRAAIERRIQRMSELSVPHDALVVYYDGPHSSLARSDPLIFAALRARSHLWRQVVAELYAAQPSTPDIISADLGPPRVTVTYVSYATPVEWGEPVAPEVWSDTNWSDAFHFNPTVGKMLLDRLMNDTAESRSTTTGRN